MKKVKFSWSKLIMVGILVVLAVFVGLMYGKMTELTNQITYLQDTTNVILSDVSGLETGIAQTMEEQNSLVESYSIDLTDMNFLTGKYTVEVSVIPKEYTDTMELSVFFGTIECPLKNDGYVYTGSVSLPLEDDFSRNLTFLFSDGKKKSTDVYKGYTGVQTYLDKVLYGVMSQSPKYRDGVLTLEDTVSYALDGADLYEFEKFELIAEWNDEEIYSQDLVVDEASDEVEDEAENLPADLYQEDTEMGEAVTESYPVTGISGDFEMSLKYEPEGAGHLRVFLQARTTDDYVFVYDLFRGELVENVETGQGLRLDEESFDRSPMYVVYDKRGGKLELNQN